MLQINQMNNSQNTAIGEVKKFLNYYIYNISVKLISMNPNNNNSFSWNYTTFYLLKSLNSIKNLFYDSLNIVLGAPDFEPATYSIYKKIKITWAEFWNPALTEKRLNQHRLNEAKIHESIKYAKLRWQETNCPHLVGEENKKHYKALERDYTSYVHYITYHKHYGSFVFGLFLLSFFIISGLSLSYFWTKICDFEKRFALSKNKFPKLRYLGNKSKMLKGLLIKNVNEIQIGINNQILKDLYTFPVDKRFYIDNPILYYSEIQLIKTNSLIKTLGY